MKEIKVYHSVWKTVVTILADLLIVALGVFAIQRGSTPVIAWLLVLFFCFAALTTAYPLLKERTTKQPYLAITDEHIIVDSRKTPEIRFADVDSFILKKFIVSALIEVHYSNEKSTPGAIMVSDLTIPPKKLFEILNERLTGKSSLK